MPDPLLEAVARAICADRKLQFHGWIAEGAFKETFRVTDRNGAPLALKVFKPVGGSPREMREAEVISRCSHANIVRCVSADTTTLNGATYPFLLEEFLQGGTLAARLHNGPLRSGDIHILGSGLIDAIAYLATSGLVHRDIKPENVMFRDNGMIPVLDDFGIVRDLNKDSLTQTWLMRGPGTPIFAAPEQLNNQKDMIDWRTDQFSLGVTLALAAFGFHPYADPGNSANDTVDNVALRKPLSKAFVTRVIASPFSPMIRMVAPYPIERYRRPSDLRDAWKACAASIS